VLAFPTENVASEAARNVDLGSALVQCPHEEPVQAGAHLRVIGGCAFPLALSPPQQPANVFSGLGTCETGGQPSSFQSLGLFSPLAWFHLVTSSIGWRKTDLTYPGDECCLVGEGVFKYRDACAPGPPDPGADSIEVFYGASTLSGWVHASGPSAEEPRKLEDRASNYGAPAGAPPPLPAVGERGPTRRWIDVEVKPPVP
jgi:hypothetical protein